MSPPPNLLALAALGLLLGFRHAFEPDHLAAVSTLATRQGRLLDACRLGLAWALGHTASVGVVVGAIVLLGLRLPDRLWPAAVLLVAAAPTRAAQLAYFLSFAAGTVVGMLAVSASLASVVRLASTRGTRWASVLHVGSALVSVMVGLLLAGRVVSQ